MSESVWLDLDDGSLVRLEVEVSVSGAYRRVYLDGPPERCRESEWPEIEPLSAVAIARESPEGEVVEPERPEPFDLGALSREERHRLDAALLDEWLESRCEPEREPCEDFDP